MGKSQHPWRTILGTMLVMGLILYGVSLLIPLELLAHKVIYKSQQIFYVPVVALWKNTILTPIFFVVLLFTLLMERLIPAKPNQKMWSISFVQDLVWFFYETILHASVIVLYIAYLSRFYQEHLSFLTIEAVNAFPAWVRFLIGVLLLDFLYWVQHWLNHKVRWFWYFHAVHHSQKEINFFTDFRYHAFEYVVRETIIVLPFLFLKVDVPTIVLFSIFRRWYTRFYHSNIKTDLGPLRYILVTPQSHRVHHSIEAHHQDLNYGALFSIWDYLFRTQYKGFDEYPDTGIHDTEFPHENSKKGWQLIWTPIVQLIYPFRVIAREVGRMFRKSRE